MLGSPYTRATPSYLETTTNGSPTEGIARAENKFPARRSAAVFPVLVLIRCSEAAAVADRRGGLCSYTKHFSSGKYRFNDSVQRVRSMGRRGEVHYGESKADNGGDHKTISISLTSALKPNTPRGTSPASGLVSFILTPKFHTKPSPSLSTRSLHLGEW